MRRVIIAQRRLTHYRVALFAALRGALLTREIELQLLVGTGTPSEKLKRDAGSLDWATVVPTYYLAGGRLCWQSLSPHLSGAALVVLTQENRLLHNHLLMLAPRRFRLAFWGHGANMQTNAPEGFKEKFKRWTTTRVDWWYAYTQVSADLVAAAGFDRSRITVLDNAVDTTDLRRALDSVAPHETAALRAELGFDGGPVGIFLGSLYRDKRLDLLFAAADAIRTQVNGFKLVLIGDGPEREAVQAWCAERPWARWAGARFGRQKALYLTLGDLMLSPGAVGLGVLDSFTCGIPIITRVGAKHGPEIAYLEHGRNSFLTGSDCTSFAGQCATLMCSPALLASLRRGCSASARRYTLENMVARFADGIEAALR
jgi:L-malate glycosyltransferase